MRQSVGSRSPTMPHWAWFIYRFYTLTLYAAQHGTMITHIRLFHAEFLTKIQKYFRAWIRDLNGIVWWINPKISWHCLLNYCSNASRCNVQYMYKKILYYTLYIMFLLMWCIRSGLFFNLCKIKNCNITMKAFNRKIIFVANYGILIFVLLNVKFSLSLHNLNAG
jgi:hypothetical protein